MTEDKSSGVAFSSKARRATYPPPIAPVAIAGVPESRPDPLASGGGEDLLDAAVTQNAIQIHRSIAQILSQVCSYRMLTRVGLSFASPAPEDHAEGLAAQRIKSGIGELCGSCGGLAGETKTAIDSRNFPFITERYRT